MDRHRPIGDGGKSYRIAFAETGGIDHYIAWLYTLFNNNISSKYGVNHWIPFTEKEAGAKEKFDSNFMSNFLRGKTLSAEAQSVLDTGLALWQYYHAKIKNNRTASVNVSFYDIREYFQGRNGKGSMNSKSMDETKGLGTGIVRSYSLYPEIVLENDSVGNQFRVIIIRK